MLNNFLFFQSVKISNILMEEMLLLQASSSHHLVKYEVGQELDASFQPTQQYHNEHSDKKHHRYMNHLTQQQYQCTHVYRVINKEVDTLAKQVVVLDSTRIFQSRGGLIFHNAFYLKVFVLILDYFYSTYWYILYSLALHIIICISLSYVI